MQYIVEALQQMHDMIFLAIKLKAQEFYKCFLKVAFVYCTFAPYMQQIVMI